MNKRRRISWLAIVTLMLISCGKETRHGGVTENRRTDNGYIYFSDHRFWFFVPLKENSGACLKSFTTENLGHPTQFRPFFAGSEKVREFLDTLQLIGVNKEFPPDYHTLKIAPAEMDYSIDRARIEEASIFKDTIKLDDRQVILSFNVLPITVYSVKPYRCK